MTSTPPAAIQALIDAHINGFNTQNNDLFLSVFGDTAIIIDGIAPVRWWNPNAPRQNPAVSQNTVDRAHARLGVPALVQRLGQRIQWLQERRLLGSVPPPARVVELVLTLVHGVAFMNLVGGDNEKDERPRFRRLLAGVLATAARATGATRSKRAAR